MVPQDLPEVLAIENASFSMPFTENLFRLELNLDIARLAVVRNETGLLGYIDYWRIDPEIHLITLAVHPSWRYQGIGTALVQTMLDDAHQNGFKEITLEVRSSNAAGLALYQKFGFQQEGIRKGYYQDNGEDALILTLRSTITVK